MHGDNKPIPRRHRQRDRSVPKVHIMGTERDHPSMHRRAEAQAAKHYEVFKQNPELANFLFNRKALEGLLEENSTLILDPNTPPFNLLTQPDATKAAKP